MPLVRELLAGEGEYCVREPAVGDAARIQRINSQGSTVGRTTSAHAVYLGWKGGLHSAIVCLQATIS
jgi:hypothetical protein